MKIGDLVKHKRTGAIGMVMSIKKAHIDKLNLLRCIKINCMHHFETSQRCLEVVSEGR